jgi:hypothetical protein
VTSGRSDHGWGEVQTDDSALGHYTFSLDDMNYWNKLVVSTMDRDGEDVPVMMTGKVFGGAGVDAAIAEAPMKAQRRLGLARERVAETLGYAL